ncbi:hypothetical protein N9J26_01250, partial [bacterium]|nr:hypothetical protein [bacterium]
DDDSPQSILYFKMIEAARKLGMSIIGLDLLRDQYQHLDTCTIEQLHKANQCTQSSHLVRNQIMSNILETVVKKGGRCVAFTHYYHAVHNYKFETGIQSLLNAQGVSNKTIRLIHPDFGYGECENYTPSEESFPVLNEAFKHSAEKERFYIEGKQSTFSRGEDYIVFLPCS